MNDPNGVVHQTAEMLRNEIRTVVQSAYRASTRIESANDAEVGLLAAELAAECSLFGYRFLALMDSAIEQSQTMANALKRGQPNG